MDELLAQFLVEARELIAAAGEDLAQLDRAPGDAARLDRAFRAIHTLKGSVAIFDMAPAGAALHAAEDLLGAARGGRRPLDGTAIAAILDCVDQLDRWVDCMARDGRLPPQAAADAERLVALIGGSKAAAVAYPSSDWAARLLAQVGGAPASARVALRYRPDPDCFFRGDDPLAVLAAVPGLISLTAAPVEPWPPLAELQPFLCNLRFEGLSDAPADAVRAALRFVADQVEIEELGGAPAAAPVDAGAVPEASRSFRVDVALLDALANDVGELIVVGNALAHVAAEADTLDRALAARLAAVRTTLDASVARLRASVGAARMTPIGPSLRRLPRLVREAASALGRDLELTMSGEGTEIDKGIADALFEPLLHLLRNAVDHGIEPAAVRLAAGKPARGSLRLAARRAGDSVVVEVADDGAGIDPAALRRAAVARGLLDAEAAARLDDQAAVELIFAPGFSTASAVSEISGRGVGMDAVRAAIERLGGRVEIASSVGQGTVIRLRLPLTAVTTRVLTVQVGDDRYAVAVESIVETASVASERIVNVGTGQAVVLRNRTLPYLSLAELLGKRGGAAAADTRLLVARAGGEPVAFGVDGFGAQLDVMLRPPAGLLAAAPGIAGTSLLGDGSVLVALDIDELVG